MISSASASALPSPVSPCLLNSQPASGRIVPAALGDLEAVAQLLAESFHSVQGWNACLFPLLLRGIYHDLHHRLQHFPPPYRCLLAYRDIALDTGAIVPVLVGSLELSGPIAWFQDQPYFYVSNLAVLAQFRRQGIGTQLLQACAHQAKVAHAAGLYLHVLKRNRTAQWFYQAQGFEPPVCSSFQRLRTIFPSRRLILAKGV